jgi:2-keto-4-pentenoate hydratase/2-oxohepta-3-ene-1,7-dioic acid hydratase in catechol pathway
MYARRCPLFVSALLLASSSLVGLDHSALAGENEKPAATQKDATNQAVRYARFQMGDTIAYGIVEGETIRQIDGDLFGTWKPTERTHPLSAVKLLVPCQPTQVIALAGNYKSHLGGADTITTVTTTTKITTAAATGQTTSDTKTAVETVSPGVVPAKFQIPQPFFKSPSCLVATSADIVIPPGAQEVHYEAELVIVIGKTAKNVSEGDALDYVLGVTCGNDVSERIWQKGDVQWWRAKGSDTFGPVGPWIAAGINYDDLQLTLRHNGEVKQQERTSDFIQNVSQTVSFISRHVTLHPGDLIFTGTPGKTSAIQPGDTVEVELEGVGVLTNGVAAGK